jgi:hypothetical protein
MVHLFWGYNPQSFLQSWYFAPHSLKCCSIYFYSDKLGKINTDVIKVGQKICVSYYCLFTWNKTYYKRDNSQTKDDRHVTISYTLLKKYSTTLQTEINFTNDIMSV